MEKTVYHGSEFLIKVPEFGKGNPHNDYGLGFYCTESKELAKEWAVSHGGNGYSNCYTLDLSNLRIMHLNQPQFNILNWLALLVKNRVFEVQDGLPSEGKEYLLETFLPDVEGYDVIIGYRADDSYFSFARAFLNNTISLAQLQKAMYLGELGEQIVLMTSKAFANIRFVEAEIAECDKYLPLKTNRDVAARRAFQDEKRREKVVGATYMLDILREGWKNNDPRLR